MGELAEGKWCRSGIGAVLSNGELQRPPSVYRHRIIRLEEKGADASFPAEPGRHHLYVSLACSWAHRTLIMRNLKGWET